MAKLPVCLKPVWPSDCLSFLPHRLCFSAVFMFPGTSDWLWWIRHWREARACLFIWNNSRPKATWSALQSTDAKETNEKTKKASSKSTQIKKNKTVKCAQKKDKKETNLKEKELKAVLSQHYLKSHFYFNKQKWDLKLEKQAQSCNKLELSFKWCDLDTQHGSSARNKITVEFS